MGVAPPSLVREITVTVTVAVAVAVAVAVVASAGVVLVGVTFIDSREGIHIVQKIGLEDGTDTNKPLKKRTRGRSNPQAGASSTP